MLRKIFILFLILFGAVSSFSQTNSKWTRVDLGEIKFSFPSPLIVDREQHKDGQVLRIFGYEKGIIADFSIKAEKSPFETINLYKVTDSRNGKSYDFGKFKIKEFNSKTNDADSYKTLYIASSNYFYKLRISGKNAVNSITNRILSSISLGGNPLLPQTNQVNDEEIVIGNNLKTSPEVMEAFNRVILKLKDKPKRLPFEKNLSQTDYSDYSRPLIILEQPSPRFPSSITINTQPFRRETDYWVRAKVVFLANGEIGEIIVYSNSDLGFQADCLEASRKIRFLPAQKDGKNIDSVNIIDFKILIEFPGMPSVRVI